MSIERTIVEASFVIPVLTGDLMTEPYAVVEGRVVDSKGHTIAGAWVGVRSRSLGKSRWASWLQNQPSLDGKTDSAGKFRLPFIPDRALGFEIFARTRIGRDW